MENKDRFRIKKPQFSFVFVRVERMARWKVEGVQKGRSHVCHVGVKILRFDSEYETVSVRETETEIVAVTRQQLFVVGAVHDEFAEFQYRETDCQWSVHQYSQTRRLHEDQVRIYYRAPLERGFARGLDGFFGSVISLALTRFRRFSQVFPKKNCSAAVCTSRTRIRFRRSDAASCSIR